MKVRFLNLVRFALFATVLGWSGTALGVTTIVPPSKDSKIELETKKGVLLRLDRPAATVFIANPDIADIQVKSPRLIYILAKQPGETTLYAVDAAERVLANLQISVKHNLSRLNRALRNLLPDADIKLTSVDTSLVLSGSVETATEAEDARRLAQSMIAENSQVLLKLDVTAPNQVHLRVRVAEVSRAVLKKLGIDWSAAFRSGGFLLGLATGNPFAAASAIALPAGLNNNIFSSFKNKNLDLNGLVDALEDEGLISVLAQPNLTAMNGKTATFLAGGEFPIVVAADDNKVTVEFKEFGVSLAFTPTIIGRNRISLQVKPEVSQLTSNGAVQISGFVIPALTTRRAETTVELGSGQSFAIAGLLQNDVTHNIDKFPGLGDLPLLGALFRSDQFKRNETELVIIVTPYLVRPVSEHKLAAPTDGLTPPTDRDRYLHGRMYRPTAQRGPRIPQGQDANGLTGPAGFVLD